MKECVNCMISFFFPSACGMNKPIQLPNGHHECRQSFDIVIHFRYSTGILSNQSGDQLMLQQENPWHLGFSVVSWQLAHPQGIAALLELFQAPSQSLLSLENSGWRLGDSEVRSHDNSGWRWLMSATFAFLKFTEMSLNFKVGIKKAPWRGDVTNVTRISQ